MLKKQIEALQKNQIVILKTYLTGSKNAEQCELEPQARIEQARLEAKRQCQSGFLMQCKSSIVPVNEGEDVERKYDLPRPNRGS